MNGLDSLDLRLLNEFQDDFPLVPEPYKRLAERLEMGEPELLARLHRLHETGTVSRVGAVLQTGQVGASTLAAMAVPPSEVERIAALVNQFPEVNHNYERDHPINLWFVITADSMDRLQTVVKKIAHQSGLELYTMPMVKAYHINLGFPLQ